MPASSQPEQPARRRYPVRTSTRREADQRVLNSSTWGFLRVRVPELAAPGRFGQEEVRRDWWQIADVVILPPRPTQLCCSSPSGAVVQVGGLDPPRVWPCSLRCGGLPRLLGVAASRPCGPCGRHIGQRGKSFQALPPGSRVLHGVATTLVAGRLPGKRYELFAAPGIAWQVLPS